MALDNRMVLLTSVTADKDQDDLNTAGLLVGELAINTNDGVLFAGADPDGTGDGSSAKTAGAPVHNAADVLGIGLSTASTAQKLGTGNSPSFAGATVKNTTASSATQGGKLILAADDNAALASTHRLGVIEFQGSESTSDTLTVGARIEAVADATWSTTENGTSLKFYTTDADAAQGVALTIDSDQAATFAGAVSIGTLDMSGGTLTLANNQISGDKVEGGTIAATTITALTTAGITASANLDIGAYTITGTQLISDIADGTAPLVVTSTTNVPNLNASTLSGVASTGFVAVGGDAMTGDLAMGANNITGLADPSSAQDAATKAYVDATAQGLTVKDSVVAASTGNVTISGLDVGQALDGITLALADRVLLKNQSTASQNGIYDINADGSAATRSSDYNAAGDVVNGTFVFVQEGTANADSGWVMTTDEVVTPGTTATAWAQFSGAGQITAGDGLDKTGNELDVNDVTVAMMADAAIQAAGEAFADNDTSLMTSAAIQDKILAYGYSTTSGTMTSLASDTSPQLGGFLDPNGAYIGMELGTDVASATALVLTGATAGLDGDFIRVTGTTTITSFTVAGNRHFFLEFAGALTLTHAGSDVLELPGGANITTAAGDVAEFFSTAANKVTCVNYTRAAQAYDTAFATAASTTTFTNKTFDANASGNTLSNVDMANDVTGTLAVGNGGTGATSLTDGGILLGSGTGAVTALAVLADSEMIVGDGTTDPVAESGDTLRISIGVGSSSSPQFTAIELGHANDTTLARGSAGVLHLQGVKIPTISSTDTLTNKTISGGTF